MFNPIEYFKSLTASLKLTKDKYLFTKVSSLDNLSGIIANRKRNNFFVGVDDSEDGATVQGGGRGYFERRPYTIFLCGYAGDDQDKRTETLNELRGIYRSFVTKIIKDKQQNPLILFDTKRIPFYEMPSAFADGIVGIYFILTVDNQINLVYDAAAWE